MLGARRVFRSAVLALALLLVAPAASALVTVGPAGSGCRFTKLQDAINLVLNSEKGGSADPFIGVAGGFVYNEALNLDGSNIGSYDVFGTTFDHPFVQIYGDYDGVCDKENGSVAQISGANKGGSVLFIHGNRRVEVILNHLQLVNANNTSGNGTGGGINFSGTGDLDLTNVDISGNHASYGGGIYTNGAIPGMTLVLHAGTTISDNTSSFDGGGVLATGETFFYATENASITGNTSGAHGGGIAFSGRGSLDVGNIQISNNQATWGGGINASGSGGHVEVTLESNTVISNNTVAGDGGGMQVEDDAHLVMIADLTTLFFNHAGSKGGGLQVAGGAKADIGSPGYAGVAAISSNDASNGGGLSVWVDGGDQSIATLFSVDAQRPLRIEGNSASGSGGGLFANAWTNNFDPTNSGFSFAVINAWGIHLDDNFAPDGAAAWLDDSQSIFIHVGPDFHFDKSDVLFQVDPGVAPAIVDCVLDAPCNTIDGNIAMDRAGNPTGGAVVYAKANSEFFADQLALRHNSGGRLMLTDINTLGTLNTSLTNCLIADNISTNNLIAAHDLWLRNCTIANNTIGGTYILSTDGGLLVHRSILWQPGTTASLQGGDFLDVITSDPQLVAKGQHIVVANDPGFVDVAQGNYHLHAASPAVDFTDCCGSVDLDGRNRGVPLLRPGTSFDVGAYELRRIAPCDEADRIFCSRFEQ